MSTPTLLPPDADPRLGPVLSGLVACLCAVLTDGGRPACACCLVWGNQPPAADFCGCECEGCGDCQGQAWVRLVRQDPVITDRQRRRNCQGWRLLTTIEVGISRCVATVAPDGTSAPTCEQRETDAWGLLADARLLREAVACCDALRDYADVLAPSAVTPLGPQGGCAGVAMQFQIEV